MAHGASVAVFLAQIVTLLVCGRLLGELMQRIGQPPVMGQLIAGILLGPSVLGALSPGLWHSLFPAGAAQHAMLDAIAQLGILLLLLVTGMETDLAVFRDARRTAISISVSGIIVPFICGVVLGALVPDSILPSSGKRLTMTLFLGTALSISSVKIVALVVRDLGFLRRTVGQLIIAAAIIDDTIGWIIMSVIFGLAIHGTVDLAVVARSVIGTAVFLALSFTVGRRLVFLTIRWANDHFESELPVIAVILAVMGFMALLTNAIGVHLVLGAFVAGILIGQSPILTRHIGEQLRGLIVALFMPVFFGLAGLTTDVSVLAHSDMLLLTVGLILLASLGKFTGAFLGGRAGGLSYPESLAVGCGMNARGSTEVIVASIGLSIGALNPSLFTAIVTMAIVTTMSMPPLLKWALQRIPMSEEERSRLEREEFESQGFVKHIERLLVAVDDSTSGQLASRLVGLLAGGRGIPTTVLHFDDNPGELHTDTRSHLRQSAAAVKAGADAADESAKPNSASPVDITARSGESATSAQTIAAEARKGYGLLFIGREPAAQGRRFDAQITRSAAGFAGAFAITIARHGRGHNPLLAPLRILVPVSGTSVSRDAAELAIALAQGSQGTVKALFVASPARRMPAWRQRFGDVLVPEDSGGAAIREVVEIGEHYGVQVQGVMRRVRAAENAILREIDRGGHTLLVMGVSPRSGEELFFGDVAAEVLERAACGIVFLSSEPPMSAAEGAPEARAQASARSSRMMEPKPRVS
ncbi:MAG TPA: cation:proton antiporter [Steroidobacteraceae bacterium]|jgi:Kef-type K+ transport system membrane component KefB/nucleotide-binding universal stress UspA family protein